MELNGGVMASRLHEFVSKELRYKFDKNYFIVDSAIIHAMTKKESYGFNTYAALRVGEIQSKTNSDDCESSEDEGDYANSPIDFVIEDK